MLGRFFIYLSRLKRGAEIVVEQLNDLPSPDIGRPKEGEHDDICLAAFMTQLCCAGQDRKKPRQVSGLCGSAL